MVVYLLALLCLLPQPTLSTITVTSPLVTALPNNTIPYFYTNYGTIHYQKPQNYRLVLLDSPLCSTTPNLTISSPSFVVVSESYSENCTDTQQAIMAQHLGFLGILVSSQYTNYASGEIVMADDGNGRKVSIACLFISKETEGLLKQIKGEIQITCRFPLPKRDRSTVTFFFSASQRNSYIFLKQLNEDYSKLQYQVDVLPVYFTFESQWTSPENCFYQIYCSYDYDNFQNGAGKAIINTQLIQYNVLRKHGVSTWLNYMQVFDEVCTYNWDNIDICHLLTRNKLGLNDIGVGDQPLETLQKWREQQKTFAFQTFPEVAINGVIFRGTLDYSSFKQTLCQSLTTLPSTCLDFDESSSSSSNNSKPLAVALAFLTLGLVLIISLACYRRCVSQEMPAEMVGRVNELVANYASLVGEKKKKRGSRREEELNEEL